MSRLKRIFFCFMRLINNSPSLSSLRGGISNSKLIRRMFCLLTFECSSFLRAARVFPISLLFVQKCWKFRSFGLSCRAIVGCVRSLASGAVRKWRRGDSRIVLASQLSAFDATGDYPKFLTARFPVLLFAVQYQINHFSLSVSGNIN